MEDEEWKARRIEIEKQALEARLLKKKRRAEVDLKNRAEVHPLHYRIRMKGLCKTRERS